MAISVGECIGPALSRTGMVLFKPFKLKKWLVLALAAALMVLGVGMPPSVNIVIQAAVRLMPQMTFDDALAWYVAHRVGVTLWLIGAAVALTPVYVACRWASSRGHFIFYENLVTNEPGVSGNWGRFRAEGKSFMKLWIAWDLILFNVYLLIFILGVAIAFPDVKHFLTTGTYEATGYTVAAIVLSVLAMLLASIPLWLGHCMIFLLVVPIMYSRRMNAKAALRVAWREIFLPNKGACLLYFLFHIVSGMVKGMFAGIGMIALAVVTLCVAVVAIYVPIVGNYPLALASLPVMVFEGAFQLHFISQFGPEYQVAWSVPAVGGFPVIVENGPPTG